MSGESECHALITAAADAKFIINSPNQDGVLEHCTKRGVGLPLFPINVVWMVNPRLLQVADALSFFISELQDTMELERLQAQFFGGAGCSALQKRIALDARENQVSV